MKKKITGSVLSAGAIVLGLAAAGCGGAIENAANGWAMLGYTLLAIVLGCAALALAGLGLVVEQRKEPQKIHKVPDQHPVEGRDGERGLCGEGPARRPAGGCDQRSFPHGERDAGRPDRHDGRDRGAVRWTAPSVYMCLRSPGAGA